MWITFDTFLCCEFVSVFFFQYLPKKYEAFPELWTPRINTDTITTHANSKQMAKYKSGIPIPSSIVLYSFSTSFLCNSFKWYRILEYAIQLVQINFYCFWISLMKFFKQIFVIENNIIRVTFALLHFQEVLELNSQVECLRKSECEWPNITSA